MLRRASFFLFSLFYFPFSNFAAAQAPGWRASMEAGKAAFSEHHYPEAEQHYLAALKFAEGFAPGDPNLQLTLRNVAVVFSVQTRPRDAEKVFAAFLSQREKASGRESAAVADVALAIGNACRMARLYPATEKFLKRALGVREKVSGAEDLKVADILEELGLLNLSWLREVGAQSSGPRNVSAPYTETSVANNPTAIHAPRTTAVPDPQPARAQLQNDNPGGEKYGRRALAIREKILGPESPELVPVLTQILGPACLRQSHFKPRKLDEALEAYNRAMAIVEKNRSAADPNWAEAIVTHARYHHSHGRFNEADQLYRGALAIFERIHGADSPRLVSPLREYASFLRDTNRPLDAEQFESRANALGAGTPATKRP